MIVTKSKQSYCRKKLPINYIKNIWFGLFISAVYVMWKCSRGLFKDTNIFDLCFPSLKEYEICVKTGDTDDAETKENAWIVLEGKKGQSKEFVMENSSKKKRFLR